MNDTVIIPKADYVALLDAIREKGGTSELMTTPEATAAVEAIETGGGGYTIDDIAEGAPTGAIPISVTSIAERAFAYKQITDVTAPNATIVGNYAFAYCVNLGTVKMPNLLSLGNSTYSAVFAYAGTTSKNAVIVLPKVNTMYRSIFDRGYFKAVDIGPDLATLNNDAFYHNTKQQTVEALILRRTASVVTAANGSALYGLRDVYVPSALISEYEAATNWSTQVEGGYITFHAIEGSQYENAYADGTPIT